MRYQKRAEGTEGNPTIWEELCSGRLIELFKFWDGRIWYTPVPRIPEHLTLIPNGVIGEWDKVPDKGVQYQNGAPPYFPGNGWEAA